MKMNQIKSFKFVAVLFALTIASCTPVPSSNLETNKNADIETKTEVETIADAVEVEKVAVNPDLELTPAENWQENNHVHGIAVNPVNPEIVYVATHYGLVQRSPEGKWFWVGSDRSDYMGFAAHPTNSDRFYSSGHPPTGGNLGFRVTDNQGEDWKVLSMVGVDFHSLAVAPSNPEVIYGWATSGQRGFFVSENGGKTWSQPKTMGLGDAPFSLAVDPENSQRVFAATRGGLFASSDRGKNWKLIPNTEYIPVIGLTLIQEGEKTAIYGYRPLPSAAGIYRSVDDGATWEAVAKDIEGVILYMAIAPNNPEIMYAINDKNTIFQSLNRGQTWKELI